MLKVCGAEGEWALYENTLSAVGADDKRRGSVKLRLGNQMFKDFGSTSDCWVHVRFAGEGAPSGLTYPREFVRVRDSNGLEIVSLVDSGLRNTPKWGVNINYREAPGTDTTAVYSESLPLASKEFQDYDINVKVTTVSSNNDTMLIRIYRNGQLRFQKTQTNSSGWEPASQLVIRERNGNDSGGMDILYAQDVIVSEGIPTVGMELATLVPSAVGTYSEFNNDYTNLDDVGYDASTVISTPTTNKRESWIFSTPSFNLGDKVIYGVVLGTVAQTDLGGVISDFQPFLRASATDYPASNIGANNINPDSFVSVFTKNPNTNNPWLASDLTALEAGILAV